MRDGAEVVHDDVQGPEEDLLLLVLGGVREGSAHMVEDSNCEPHPQVVFAGQLLGLPVVDRVLEVVLADSQQHRSV